MKVIKSEDGFYVFEDGSRIPHNDKVGYAAKKAANYGDIVLPKVDIKNIADDSKKFFIKRRKK